MTKKILVFILGSSNSEYRELHNTIKQTWYTRKHKDVEILFYTDNEKQINKSNYPILSDEELILPCNDGMHNIGVKTIMAFEWALQMYNFNYIFRCNMGSFVDTNKLINFVSTKPSTKFYCGIIGTFCNLIKFASGSGYFLSKDLVELIVKNKTMWEHNLIDDVALGLFMKNFDIPINETATRLSFTDVEPLYQIGNEEVDYISPEHLYHIRCRSTHRDKDFKKLKELFEQ